MIIRFLVFFSISVSIFGAQTYPVGWHNVPGVEISAQEFLNLHPEVDLIFSYFEGSWSLIDRLERPRETSFESLSFLDPDRAYWIHSNPIYSIEISGSQGNIGISFSASGVSTETSLDFYYSVDDGLSWKMSTNITGTTTISDPATTYQILWYSDQDISEFQDKVRIRLDMGTGDAEGSGFSESFTIDPSSEPQGAPSPTLLNFVPDLDDPAVPVSLGRVDLRFSESLLSSSISTNLVRLYQGDVPVETVQVLKKNFLTLRLSQELSYNTAYRVEVSSSLQSIRGIALAESYSWSFQTEPEPNLNLFESVSAEEWNETAVRKVLHAFAFGGHTSDEQIQKWASDPPADAIEEMLSLYPVNYLLSPPQEDYIHLHGKSLLSLAKHWSSSGSEIETGLRQEYDVETEENAAVCTWITAVTKRGLNPFFHKIGLFETNYHMAVNQEKDLSSKELIGYYDRVMGQHSLNQSYQKVLLEAAVSPAVAEQYKHADNRYENGEFLGNEDFAREIHQLFFGILGDSDISDPAFAGYPATIQQYQDYSDYHEYISIRHTARALTDMPTHGEEDQISYGTEFHHQAPLEILGVEIEGTNAKEKIEKLVEEDINHPESLKNLPLIITKVLADDFMDSQTEATVQNAWASMESKNFLDFLRSYAISKVFHSPKRVKFWTSFDRNLIYHNLTHTSNLVSFHDTPILAKLLSLEGALFFRPLHNVFGGQTGLEASESSKVLKEAFNTSSARHGETLDPLGTYSNQSWERDWGAQISRTNTNEFQVESIAELLWEKLIADGLKNFGVLERAQTYALLAEGKDFATVADPTNPDQTYTSEEIGTDPTLAGIYASLAQSQLEYLDNYRDNRNQLRWEENYRVGIALAFIASTPYMFAQEGL